MSIETITLNLGELALGYTLLGYITSSFISVLQSRKPIG
jgi:hypothetical protein